MDGQNAQSSADCGWSGVVRGGNDEDFRLSSFQIHYPLSFWPTANWGTPAIIFCFVFLYFVFAGAGPWSIDAMIARRAGKRID